MAIASDRMLLQAPSGDGTQLHGGVQVDRYQLRQAPLGHGHSVQAVHACHGQRMMGHDDEAGFGGAREFLEQRDQPLDVGVVQRRVDLIEHAEW